MLRQDSIQSAELKKKESPFRAKCHEIFCCPLKQVHLKENTEPEGLCPWGPCSVGGVPVPVCAVCARLCGGSRALSLACLSDAHRSPLAQRCFLCSKLCLFQLPRHTLPFLWLPEAACSSRSVPGSLQGLLELHSALSLALTSDPACPSTLHAIRLLHSARE